MKRFRGEARAGLLLATVGAAALGLAAPAMAAGDLIVAVPASIEPANLDFQVDPYTTTILFDSFLTDPLVVQAPDGSFVPGLATAWEASEDQTVFTLTLREGVTFQDGTPFNAEAVVYNIERTMAPETASALLANNFDGLASVVAEGDMTVVFTFDSAKTNFIDVIAQAPIWSPTAAAASTPQEFDRELVGTGPFRLVEWVANDYIRMERWDDYGGWNDVQEHEGPALLDSVTFRFIGEPAVLGSIVTTGEAHIGYQIPALDAELYTDSDEFTLMQRGQSGTGLSMVMNVRNPPLSDIRVRQAILYGRDMPAVNELLFDGLYEPSDGPLNNIHPCFWPGASEMYPHDPEQAMALLDEAGWVDDGFGTRVASGVEGVADGTPLSIRWNVLHHREIGEAVQAQLAEIGIALVVEQLPGPIQLERVQTRDFDIMYERLRNRTPRILADIWDPANDQPGGWAWTGYDDPALTAVLQEMNDSLDLESRCAAAETAQQMIMEAAVMVPTLSDPVFYALSNDVEGFKLGAEGVFFFLHDVTLAE